MSIDWIEYKLEELLAYEQPTAYIVNSTDYHESYKTPVLTAGKSFIIGYTNEKIGIYDKLPVIIFDDFTTASQYVNFPFKVKSSAMKILTANSELVLPKFIFYRMQTIQFNHDTHKRYWIQQYSQIKVKIPPLPEQERIVAKIEELFSQLDAAVAELKSVKEKLVIYRQAVLKEAFEKYATEDKELKCFIDSPRYGTSKKCDYYTDEQYIPVYRIPNIDYSTGRVSHEDIKKANFAKEELLKLQLEIGDILLIRSNGSLNLVGRAALITEQDVHGVFAGYLIRIRIKDKIALVPQYLLYALSSSKARSYIERTAKSTSGVNNINSEEISKLKIPYCSPEKQQLVLNQIETILPFCDTIEQSVDTALQQAAALRQSILKQAFEGNL